MRYNVRLYSYNVYCPTTPSSHTLNISPPPTNYLPPPHRPRLPLPLTLTRPLMKNTSIVNRPYILLPHPPIFRPKHQIRRHPLKHRAAPPNWITHIPLPLNLVHQRPDVQIILAVRILCENILKLLRPEAPLGIKRVAVGAVLGAVDARQVDAETRVREPGGGGGVGEVEVDYYEGDGGEDDAETEVVEPNIGVAGPQDAVAIAIEELAVLLQHGLVPVLFGPVAIGRAVRLVVSGGDVGAGQA